MKDKQNHFGFYFQSTFYSISPSMLTTSYRRYKLSSTTTIPDSLCKSWGQLLVGNLYFCWILENKFIGVVFIVSIGTKLCKEPQHFLRLLIAATGQNQQKFYYENIDKTFSSLITGSKIKSSFTGWYLILPK